MAKSFDDYMLSAGYPGFEGSLPGPAEPAPAAPTPIFVPGLRVPGAVNPLGNIYGNEWGQPLLSATNPAPGVVDHTDFTPAEATPDPIYARPEDYGQSSVLLAGQSGLISTNETVNVSVPFTDELKQKVLAQSFGDPAAPATSPTNWLLIGAVSLAAIWLLREH